MAMDSQKYYLVEGWEKLPTDQLIGVRSYLREKQLVENNTHHFVNLSSLQHLVRDELYRRLLAGDKLAV